MSSFQAVRGTYDLLPVDTRYWHQLEAEAHRLAQLYGYREIRTPMFEEAELFTRGLGVMAGIVERELWTFHDKFGKKLALRADMTAAVVRAYKQHKLGDQKGLTKLYYLAPVFLLGKDTEAGSRQAHQFGVEALGASSPALDAEVIALASAFCEKIGLRGHVVELNTLGSEKCRPEYEERLRSFFSGRSAELCGTCKRKYKAHPLWVLGCEEEQCVRLAQVAPAIFGVLDPDTRSHFNSVKRFLTDMEVPFELNPRVLRDVEYYSSTVFRVVHDGHVLGYGGRYDGLVAELGGRPTPAIGFALSMDAIVEGIRGNEDSDQNDDRPRVVLVPEGPEATRVMVPVLHLLLKLGVRVEMAYGNHRRAHRDCVTVVLTEADAYRGHAVVEDRDRGKTQKIVAGKLGERLVEYLETDSGDEDVRSTRKKLTRTRRKPTGSSDSDGVEKNGERPRSPERTSRRSPERDEDSSQDSQRESRSSRRRRRRKKSRIGPAEPETRVKESRPAEAEKAFVPALHISGSEQAPKPEPSEPAERPTRKQRPVSAALPADLGSGSAVDWSIGGLGTVDSGKKTESDQDPPAARGGRRYTPRRRTKSEGERE